MDVTVAISAELDQIFSCVVTQQASRAEVVKDRQSRADFQRLAEAIGLFERTANALCSGRVCFSRRGESSGSIGLICKPSSLHFNVEMRWNI